MMKVEIEVLLRETEIANSLTIELEARRLPEYFFYWFPLSMQAWLDLCSDGAYRNYQRSYQLIEAGSTAIAAHFRGKQVEVISLGSGQGDKDAMVLKALAEMGKEVVYRPVDSSQGLLELACLEAQNLGITAKGCKANILDENHLKSITTTTSTSPPRLYLMLGGTLGAFHAPDYLARLYNLLSPGDFLLVDGEILVQDLTIAGYDNPLNRRFAFGPLTSIGVTEADGELLFDMVEDSELPGLFRLSKHFRASRELDIQLAGQTIRLAAGEAIDMGHSGKYSEERVIALFDGATPFKLIEQFMTPKRNFLMALLAK